MTQRTITNGMEYAAEKLSEISDCHSLSEAKDKARYALEALVDAGIVITRRDENGNKDADGIYHEARFENPVSR